jgi:hypothetical protein
MARKIGGAKQVFDEGLNVFNGKIRQLLSGSEDQSNVRY